MRFERELMQLLLSLYTHLGRRTSVLLARIIIYKGLTKYLLGDHLDEFFYSFTAFPLLFLSFLLLFEVGFLFGKSKLNLLPQWLNFICFVWLVFPTKNDEETKKFKLFLLGKLTK